MQEGVRRNRRKLNERGWWKRRKHERGGKMKEEIRWKRRED